MYESRKTLNIDDARVDQDQMVIRIGQQCVFESIERFRFRDARLGHDPRDRFAQRGSRHGVIVGDDRYR